jgi:hypothetical protein
MDQRTWWVIGLLLSMLTLSVGVRAADDLLVLYNGEKALPARLAIGAWGAPATGAAAPTTMPVAVGTRAGLRLAVSGRNQGSRLELTTPTDLSAVLADKHAYLELYLRAVPGDGQGTTTSAAPNVALPGLPNLRVTLVTEKGDALLSAPMSEIFPRVEIAGTWLQVALPLATLEAATTPGGALTRLLFTADGPGELLVGRVAFVRDTTPMTVTVTTFPPAPEVDQVVALTAVVSSGLARPSITWCFNALAGPAVDATGERTTARFPAAGPYVVQCTVSDSGGQKEAVKGQVEVEAQ